LYGLFQRRAPFGFIPARMAKFTLGVLAGFSYARHPQQTQRIVLNRYTGLFGLLIWLGGQGLLDVGLWGWIFSDFVIALGLILRLKSSSILMAIMLTLFIPKILLQQGIWGNNAVSKSEKTLLISKTKPNKPVSNPSSDST
jgi:hypothetical protein